MTPVTAPSYLEGVSGNGAQQLAPLLGCSLFEKLSWSALEDVSQSFDGVQFDASALTRFKVTDGCLTDANCLGKLCLSESAFLTPFFEAKHQWSHGRQYTDTRILTQYGHAYMMG